MLDLIWNVGTTLSGLPASIWIIGSGILAQIRDFYPDLPPTYGPKSEFLSRL
jgi:hypothetical protein